MKTLFLIRHAKSSWKEANLSDSKRPLNKRGKKDAPFMAAKLAEFNETLDLIVSSPAKRARTTAKRFAEQFNIGKDKFMLEDNLYLADEADIMEIIQLLPDEAEAVAIFGHNPGYTYFANLFTNYYIENVPTCGIVKLISVVDEWSEFDPSNTRLAAVHFPKQYLEE